MSKSSIYEKIADQICGEIYSGLFKTGDKLYSRKELVTRYGISPVTATRVQNALARRGIVRKVRGGGIYLLPLRRSDFENKLALGREGVLKKIIYLNVIYPHESDYHDRYAAVLKNEVVKSGIAYEEYSIKSSDISERLHQYFEVEPNTGYVVINKGSLPIFYAASVLLDTSVPSVLVDGITVGSECVLADSFDGMRQIVEAFLKRGCERFIYGEHFAEYFSGINSSERLAGAKLNLQKHQLPLEIVSSGIYDDLLDLVTADKRKTAVIFPQDTPAIRFWGMLKQRGLTHVQVSGFDHYSPLKEKAPILTIEPDFKLWAQETIRLLQEESFLSSQVVRIPGKLIVP